MKCGYNNCKLGGNVEKEDAIKVGGRYFHKECENKKTIKSECSNKLNSIGMIPKLVGIFLKKVVDDDCMDLDYLQFTIDYIILHKLKLTNPYGVKYYMGDYKIKAEYDKYLSKKISSEINKGMIWESEEPTNFKPPETQMPSYLKILK